jgi:hypothetical protein
VSAQAFVADSGCGCEGDRGVVFELVHHDCESEKEQLFRLYEIW